MRLGGPVYGEAGTPDLWAKTVRQTGYAAAYCPGALMRQRPDEKLEQAYVAAAAKADIVIAEVGAWSNPISLNDDERKKASAMCQERLALADRIDARCCVNIPGSRGKKWDGPSPDNYTQATFDLIVESVRKIIDGVKPTRSCYALEMMPWIFPDSPDSYLALMKAIDRKALGVHLDPVNIVTSPQRYYENGKLLKECFSKLGGMIRSCHAKDIVLSDRLTVHLDECRPGTGGLDYTTYLQQLAAIAPDTPLMLEHLSAEADYRLAAEYIRKVAREADIHMQGA